ncbi:MAG: GNAT family N-acetyltransferase [Thermoanaerobaculia bacterium]
MEIRHAPERRRFESDHPDPGVLNYAVRGEGRLELKSTEVPASLEGQGVGSALAREAMDYARAHDYRVIATCPFVRGWLERHPEYSDIVE